jgi:hypothetical protein
MSHSCRRFQECSREFAHRVKAGVDKVCNTDWASWHTTYPAPFEWVIANYICPTDEMDSLVKDAVAQKGIQWHEISSSGEDECEKTSARSPSEAKRCASRDLRRSRYLDMRVSMRWSRLRGMVSWRHERRHM